MSRESDVQEMIEIVEEIKTQKKYRDQFVLHVSQAKSDIEKDNILEGRPLQEHVEYYNKYLLELLNRIDRANQRIMADFEEPPSPSELAIDDHSLEPHKKKKEEFYISSRTRRKYLKEIGASEEMIKRILHPKKEKKKRFEEVDYTIYSPSLYGRLSNLFFEGTALNLIRSYPKSFENLSKAIRSSDIRVLSRTYISMMLFTTVLGFFCFFFLGIIISFLLKLPIVTSIIISIIVAFLLSLLFIGIFFMYPAVVSGSRSRMIKNDLPFVIIHMAAVAGSGAKPLSMFKLIVTSGEYRGLEGEIKKILNYINLFGYNTSTALKTVAATTPSARFRDLLTGMVATIESGGSLKSYLSSMAADAMHTYELERKKYVQVLSTYSDIYTGILIAAPLLFMVTLAIINLLGGDIGGISIQSIAVIGTYAVIPFLNIAFILFLNIIQPEI